MEENSTPIIKNLIKKALDKLYKEDFHSLICLKHEKHVGERACVFRFGIYFNQILRRYKQFNGYNLDCEYNRSCEEPKRKGSGPLMTPDVILHKRGSHDNNFVVMEFKGWWSRDGQEEDLNKLKEMVDPNGTYKYQFGYAIMLNQEEKGKNRYTIQEVTEKT